MLNTIILEPSAIQRILHLRNEKQAPNLKLRIYIVGGGCSGFQYGFAFEEAATENDYVLNFPTTDSSVTVLIDKMSMMYLSGASVRYEQNLQGSKFLVSNPNADSTCSCGASFSA